MSKEKEECSEKESCCDEETNQAETIASESPNYGEFIDLHGSQGRLGTPIEESGQPNRTGGSTVAEKCDRSSGQRVDSDEEYHSASEGECCHRDWDSVGGVVNDDSNISDVFKKTTLSDSVSGSDGESDHIEGGEERTEDTLKESKEKKADELEERRKVEESLSDDEKLERKSESQKIKDEGNQLFREGSYKEAICLYNQALDKCPLTFAKDRSIMFSNRAVCQMKTEDDTDAIASCSQALELHPHYMKALLRRAELYEKTDKLDEALVDYQKAVEMDPSQHAARHSALKLADLIKERNEKMKTEMLGKLKDLGNMILKPFGMSTDNFKLQQDPNTGSYSVNFQQGEQRK